MSSTRLRALKRRWLGLRHPAQNLVEFGMVVAVVSVFGLAGLNMLGRAEEGYFIPLAASLAPQAPSGTDDVVHPTQVTINCAPTTVIVGNPASCSFTARDAWTNKRTWPQGSIHLFVNGADSGLTCSLAQDTSSGDGALSKCSSSWTPTLSNVPSATLAAHYVPTDGAHAAPVSDPSQMLTVQELPTISFSPMTGQTTACFDPNSGYAGSPEKVEIGHPIICHLTVSNSGGPIAGTPIQVSGSLADSGGTAHFSCFTNNNRGALPACNPEGPSFSGNTDATGQLTFVYRRYYILPSPTTTATETFTASATAYPGATAAHSVTIAPANVAAVSTAGHFTDMAVQCTSNVPAGAQTAWVATQSGLALKSDNRLTGTNGSLVTCTIVVVDTEPAGAYASPPTGNIDNEDAFSPLGTVVWFDETNTPIPNATGGNASCTLSMGNPLGAPYLPQQLLGLPNYASSCNVTMKLIGHHNLHAQYNGEPVLPHGHRPVQSQPIDSDFM